MIFVEKFTNSIFTSNSYIIYSGNESNAWLVDPGDSEPLIEWFNKKNKIPVGILITHSHFDHIYGINHIVDKYPEIIIYSSEQAKKGMLSSKLNASYYMEFPFVVKSKYIITINHNESIVINENTNATVHYTPGHNNDCISYQIENYLFTGDALIPGIKVHIKSKYSNKIQAVQSINYMVDSFNPDTFICPGHGDICQLKKININDLICSDSEKFVSAAGNIK